MLRHRLRAFTENGYTLLRAFTERWNPLLRALTDEYVLPAFTEK